MLWWGLFALFGRRRDIMKHLLSVQRKLLGDGSVWKNRSDWLWSPFREEDLSFFDRFGFEDLRSADFLWLRILRRQLQIGRRIFPFDRLTSMKLLLVFLLN